MVKESLDESILVYNLGSEIFPYMGFLLEKIYFKGLSF